MRLCLILIFILISSSVIGQSIQTEFIVKSKFSFATSSDFKNTDEHRLYLHFDDSLRVSEKIIIDENYTSFLDSTLSPEIRFNFVKPISKRFALKIGLGTYFYSYMRHSILNERETINTGEIDTLIYYPGQIIYSSYPLGCSYYLNSPNDIEVSDEKSLSSIWYFTIPVGLEFELIPKRISMGINAALKTPFNFKVRSETIQLISEEEDGENVCQWILEHREDGSGKDFNHFLFDLEYDLVANLTEKICAEISVSKSMTSIFRNENLIHKPWNLSIGFRFKFFKTNTSPSLSHTKPAD